MLTRASAPVPSEPTGTTSSVETIEFDSNAGLLSQTGLSDRLTKRAELVGDLTKLKENVEEQTAKISELTIKNEELVDENWELTRQNEKLATKNSELARKIQELENKNSNLAKKNQKLATKNSELARKNGVVATTNEVLNTTIKSLTTHISSLNREVADCKKDIKPIEGAGDLNEVIKMLGRKKADFEYELDNVGAFLESNKSRFSKYFFAGGLAWILEFAKKVEGQDRFLSIFLRASNCGGENRRWSVNVIFRLSLLNQSGGQNCSLEYTKDFSTALPAWGWQKFISTNQLRTGGFIKSNKIKVHVSLLFGEVVRSD